MSDRIERAVSGIEEGRNVTRLVNTEMTRDEQLEFARRLWQNGTNPRTSNSDWTRLVGSAEVTFRTTNGERQVNDIVFNGRDIYDTPAEAARRGQQQESARMLRERPSASGAGLYRGESTGRPGESTARPADSTGRPATPAEQEARDNFQRCMDQRGPNSSVTVERAVCAATSGHTPEGVRVQPVQERVRTESTKPPQP